MEEKEHVYLINVHRKYTTYDEDDIYEKFWEEDSVPEPVYKTFASASQYMKTLLENHLEAGDVVCPTMDNEGRIWILKVVHNGIDESDDSKFKCEIRYSVICYTLCD